MIGVFLASAALVAAPEYLTEVVSSPIEAVGTASEIAARGRRCIASSFGAGVAGGELIVSDSDNVIVARNASSYQDGLMRWQIRSRVTFEARDGRFRISQTGLERFNDQSGGWSPIGKWRGSGWQKAEASYSASAAALADCVTAAKADDW